MAALDQTYEFQTRVIRPLRSPIFKGGQMEWEEYYKGSRVISSPDVNPAVLRNLAYDPNIFDGYWKPEIRMMVGAQREPLAPAGAYTGTRGRGGNGGGDCGPRPLVSYQKNPAYERPSFFSEKLDRCTTGGPVTLSSDGSSFTEVLNVKLPPGSVAVVNSVTLFLESGPAFDDVLWIVTVDGKSIPGLDGVAACGAQSGVPLPINPTAKSAEGGRVIVYGRSSTVGVPHFGRAAISGWHLRAPVGTGTTSPLGWLAQ